MDRILHGAEYNPEQWFYEPGVLESDIELMKQANIDVVTLGVFAWSFLEPKEGRYELDWMDDVISRLGDAGISVILATPSGARPRWMAEKYPEVLRVSCDRRRNLFGGRHNHCLSSPVYREKVYMIDRLLSERFGSRDNVLMWHISNEFSGECHCELCQEEFRRWLFERYEGDLDRLNRLWWTSFWSHRYFSWDEIVSPSPIGESNVHGLNLDWKRFVTHKTADFIRNEIKAVRDGGSSLPVTTNLMGFQRDLDYWKIAELLDVVSWDCYPLWHGKGSSVRRVADGGLDHNWDELGRDWVLAEGVAWAHSLHRALGGGRPFLLMETTPSHTNWQPWSKPKKPGMHVLSSLLAVAEGSDSVQYFQWRAGRGGSEKFHGAVMYHGRDADSRTFLEVRQLGSVLKRLECLAGSRVNSPVAVFFDWENRWALEDAEGPVNTGALDYVAECMRFFSAWRRLGIGCDIVGPSSDWSSYKVVVAPLAYMSGRAFKDKVREFVDLGGVFVSTVWSAVVDEHDLCYESDAPGLLPDLPAVRSREIDVLVEGEKRLVSCEWGVGSARLLCDVVELPEDGVEVLGEFCDGYYAGSPAVFRARQGKGAVYYCASLFDDFLTGGLVRELASYCGIEGLFDFVPEGLEVSVRETADGRRFFFVLNFRECAMFLKLPNGVFRDVISGCEFLGRLRLGPYGYAVLERL